MTTTFPFPIVRRDTPRVRVPCPNCGRRTQIERRASYAGRFELLCPGCERVLRVDETTRGALGYGTVTEEAPRPRRRTT